MSAAFDRRRFLGLTAAGAFGLSCAPLRRDRWARRSGALAGQPPWAEPSAEQRQALLPAERTPEGMLEVFLLGGMSPWEGFYTVPELCHPTQGGDYAGQQWWTYQSQGPLSVPDWWDRCGPSGAPITVPYGTDTIGRTVHLGPFVHALRDRPDMLARMRVWVMAHTLEPHEGGTPLAMTGQARGNPRGAALGTHLQRFYEERGSADRTAPYSYTVYMSSFDPNAGNNGDTASAVGLHRASSRPMAVHLGPDLDLAQQLARPATAGYREPLDALIKHYLSAVQGRLQTPSGAPIRSPALGDYAFARDLMERHEAIQALLPDGLLAPLTTTVCHGPGSFDSIRGVISDETTTGLGLARHLLTAPTDGARYVQVIDSGVYLDPEGMGYDSHTNHVEQQGTNLTQLLRGLSDAINLPGEGDPTKLDLDRHFVLLNNEFGRAPYPELTFANPSGSGTNHWPFGYVVVGFGAFVDPERSGVFGAIGANGYATEYLSPSEHRAAMLLAMGAWPFTHESFAVGDVRSVKTELQAAHWLREHVLGYTA